MNPTTIFIIAGENSGDLHASKLMKELKRMKSDIQFIGIGGKRMVDEGLNCIYPLDKISVVGFTEVVKNISKIKKAFDKCKETLRSNFVDLVVLVDFPGFNLRVAESAKRLGLPVCYYIAPQLWAWGTHRIEKLKKFVDLLLVVFPFEEKFFSTYIDRVVFVGHPLLDEPMFQDNFPDFEEREDAIALLPGSRKTELFHHQKLIYELVAILKKKLPNYKIKIPVTNIYEIETIKKILGLYSNEVEISLNSYEILKHSKVGIIKSGTSNLEAALLGLPFVMFYKTSIPTYLIAKLLIKIEYLSIVNILLSGRYVPEFIQKEASAEKIIKAMLEMLTNREIYLEIQNKFREIKNIIGGSGASKRTAQEICNRFRI
ncbi:MAG: lipid-A-disaccharide synthase [Ignavibacteria bacterium]|nr:lipid-A-disaccharide synthase [Ignavibacteria bacterium]